MPISSDGQGLVFPSDTESGVDYRRLSANVVFRQPLFTFQDAVERTLDVFNAQRDARSTRLAIGAVMKAYRGLPKYHDWPYYNSRYVVNLVASYSTGTVVFDLSGGAYEYLLTISGGTWPEWAGFGTIRIGQTNYDVLQRVDSTRITLDSRRHPPADLTATAFTIFRDRYPLPIDFRRADRVLEPNSLRELSSSSPSSVAASQVFLRGSATPYEATIIGDPKFQGGLALQITPCPTSAQTLVFLYKRAMRPLRTEKYQTGTLAITADSASITGSSVVWTDDMIGAVLRISGDANEPTGIAGSLATGDVNVAKYERMIQGVTGSTVILVDETLPESLSGLGYTISDPIDVHEIMIDAFYRLAETEFARLTVRDDANARAQVFMAELDVARDAARTSSAIQSANIGQSEYYSILGDVSPTTAASV